MDIHTTDKGDMKVMKDTRVTYMTWRFQLNCGLVI